MKLLIITTCVFATCVFADGGIKGRSASSYGYDSSPLKPVMYSNGASGSGSNSGSTSDDNSAANNNYGWGDSANDNSNERGPEPTGPEGSGNDKSNVDVSNNNNKKKLSPVLNVKSGQRLLWGLQLHNSEKVPVEQVKEDMPSKLGSGVDVKPKEILGSGPAKEGEPIDSVAVPSIVGGKRRLEDGDQGNQNSNAQPAIAVPKPEEPKAEPSSGGFSLSWSTVHSPSIQVPKPSSGPFRVIQSVGHQGPSQMIPMSQVVPQVAVLGQESPKPASPVYQPQIVWAQAPSHVESQPQETIPQVQVSQIPLHWNRPVAWVSQISDQRQVVAPKKEAVQPQVVYAQQWPMRSNPIPIQMISVQPHWSQVLSSQIPSYAPQPSINPVQSHHQAPVSCEPGPQVVSNIQYTPSINPPVYQGHPTEKSVVSQHVRPDMYILPIPSPAKSVSKGIPVKGFGESTVGVYQSAGPQWQIINPQPASSAAPQGYPNLYYGNVQPSLVISADSIESQRQPSVNVVESGPVDLRPVDQSESASSGNIIPHYYAWPLGGHIKSR